VADDSFAAALCASRKIQIRSRESRSRRTPEGVRFAAAVVTDPSFVAALERAKARLDTLDWYPEPVRIDRVRLYVAPWFFRLPGFRRYQGYAFWRTILLKHEGVSDDLITHELCHVWQGQQRPLHMSWKHVTTRYRSNPYEIQARRAVAETQAR
jgi:hypothetical protein